MVEAMELNEAARRLAFGRILRMAARPAEPGDVAEYERCRAIIMEGVTPYEDRAPNLARDYGNGAAGQW
jgi:hypothetical protein